MSDARSLLIELGTEELPPGALDQLAGAFAHGICEGLNQRGVAADTANARIWCSPRRLAVLVPAVASAQPDRMQERRGPAVSAALDADGAPTRALTGFARSCGVEVADLEKLETEQGVWFVHRAVQPGQPLAALVPEILGETLRALPIPKPMRWGDHDFSFVRPAHWLVILHGAEVIDAEIFGLASTRQSRGHRFHHPQPVHIADADSWLDALRAAKVLADPVERRARIRAEIESARATTGGNPRLSDALLDEIANLTEWPVAVACTFDPDFLDVPPEALVMTMETNQKFVPVFDADGALGARFIGIANLASKEPDRVRAGYERVIRPRFADAKFFLDEDRKQPLAAQQEALKSVTYQRALGSVWDKCVRVAELARVIAHRVGVDAGLATRAAALSKCDLMTRMVGEFPELQGVMGRYYATADGEAPEIALALDEFYRPRFGGDAIATGPVGRVLAVAERLDTLAGIFAVGQKPSGNKDPFALRRAALGLARTLIEGGLELDLKAHLREHLEIVQAHMRHVAIALESGKAEPHGYRGDRDSPATLASEIYAFVLDRLRGYYAEQGIGAEAFEAVRALAPSDLTDFDRRLHAVVAFARLPEAEALAAANKRIGNLLRQADAATGPGPGIDADLLEAGAERALAEALVAAEGDTAPLIGRRDYVDLLKRLAGLRDPVDRYFESVLVMAEDAAIRHNRLALLGRLQNLFLQVADIGRLAGT